MKPTRCTPASSDHVCLKLCPSFFEGHCTPPHAPQGLVHDRHMGVRFAGFEQFCQSMLVAQWQKDSNEGSNVKPCFGPQ
jgi:hypothetical protein